MPIGTGYDNAYCVHLSVFASETVPILRHLQKNISTTASSDSYNILPQNFMAYLFTCISCTTSYRSL